MSNTVKPANRPHSLDAYRKAAAKKAEKTGPFEFWVDDDNKLEIPRPNGATILAVEEATSSREIISLLAGDHAEQLMAIFEAEDFEVMQQVSQDLQRHFGLGQD